MAKTTLTKQLEKEIFRATSKQGVFSCFEVTIGWYGKERVDYITYDTKGTWRCYEIKISKADFRSKSHNTFLGHFNYYVMPRQLYDEVKDEIPIHVGVYVGGYCIKKAKRQALGTDESILKDSMIRSLYRDAVKLMKSNDPATIDVLSGRLQRTQREMEKYRRMYRELHVKGIEKYGSQWYKD